MVKCFKIECLTNLHVGSGENNYNIVDKEVEKDPILGTPTIHASGIKGALREHLKARNFDWVSEAFGVAMTRDAADFAFGKLKILSANLLAMPMRASDGKALYYMVSTNELLDTFHNLNKAFSIDCSIVPGDGQQVQAEGKNCLLSDQKVPVLENRLALMDAADLKRIALPVIARNRIHGHKNLWYEELVPHKSVFYFYAICQDAQLMEKFAEAICRETVQLGGNASVGCGFTKISVIGGSAQ